jgi:hypothetical protein
MKIYINWKLDNTINRTWLLNLSTDPMIIWSWRWTLDGTQFNWSIDEVRIYNRALSDSEISALYNATK